jgi:signal transduction histidine kinase
MKRNQEKLQRLNEKLGLLGSITRHDVQNQLAVLFGWLDIAIADCRDEKLRNQLISARNAADTIRDQLEFTADYQEMGVASPKWIGAKEALAQGSSTLTLAGVSVKSELDDLEILADPMIHKVFHNLIDNSLRHGKRVDTIRLRYTASEDGAKVVYEDNGVGIPEKEKQLVFNQGYGKHTGYGLHLSKEILAITGIGIRETGEEGKGARFELLLPKESFRIRGKT